MQRLHSYQVEAVYAPCQKKTKQSSSGPAVLLKKSVISITTGNN